ncbi:hypothetical protein ACWCYY_33945 [Kitasatospora sp. NPDC001664]
MDTEPAPGSAAEHTAHRLRTELLAVASVLSTGRPPLLVREWTDTQELHGQAVGQRYFVLVAVERGPGAEQFDEVTTAFAASGWKAHRWTGHTEGTAWASAKRDGIEVTAHQGRGTGVITVSAHTPVVFVPGRESLRQPLHTLSTGTGLLCSDCQGWGICLICEGTGRHHTPGRMSYGRCQCWGGQAGPGRCVDCAGQGRTEPPVPPPWKRQEPAPAESPAPAEAVPASALDALAVATGRPCTCGSLSCHWQLARTRTELRVSAPCQSCARPRSYTFPLPAAAR